MQKTAQKRMKMSSNDMPVQTGRVRLLEKSEKELKRAKLVRKRIPDLVYKSAPKAQKRSTIEIEIGAEGAETPQKGIRGGPQGTNIDEMHKNNAYPLKSITSWHRRRRRRNAQKHILHKI
jgi:hypothetical protein